MTRRNFVNQLSALGMISWANVPLSNTKQSVMMMREIPSSGEKLPVVGVGTWQTFDVSDQKTFTALKEVLDVLLLHGGSVIDSSPMYGRSEAVVGKLSTEMGINDKLFMATKVWTSGKEEGIRQMNDSFSKMGRKKMDLMQIHNLVDWKTHYKTLQQWKDEGKIRYIGLTHYLDSAHDQLGKIITENNVDFIQINYSIIDREAEDRLFHIAQEKNVGIIINQPFGGGGLFSKVRGKQVPEWAQEFDCNSWGCFFLKYILAHSAVTCVIPGTSKASHMKDNASAGLGKMPTAAARKKMVDIVSSL